jgi:biopolymer transport protein ExbD
MKIPRTEIKKARIEIIPMIDAIFFLLVFFMMTSLQMVQLSSRKVQLPQSATAQKRGDVKNKVVVTIDKNGAYFVNQDSVQLAQILPLLTDQIKAAPDMTVIINCDRAQQVAQFVKVFDLVKQSNAAQVMIATEPKSPDQMGS